MGIVYRGPCAACHRTDQVTLYVHAPPGRPPGRGWFCDSCTRAGRHKEYFEPLSLVGIVLAGVGVALFTFVAAFALASFIPGR